MVIQKKDVAGKIKTAILKLGVMHMNREEIITRIKEKLEILTLEQLEWIQLQIWLDELED